MANENTATLQRQSAERAEEEERVLAQNAHDGEKRVASLRIATWFLLGIAFSATAQGTSAEHEGPRENPMHFAMIFSWIIFAVAVAIILRRVKFTPRRARTWPLLFMAVDFAVFCTLAATSDEAPRNEINLGTLAILVTFSVARFNRLHVWVSAWMASLGYVIACYAQSRRFHTDFDWRSGLIAVSCFTVIAVMVGWANKRIREMFVVLRRTENLSRFLPRQVVRRVLASGASQLQPTQREVTILFSDIRDFTSLSEHLEPRAVLELLDEYFGHMTQIVKGHDGMVNKFIGDGMLAVWGVPDEQPDHAERALRAALDMRKATAELARAWKASGRPDLRIGIGLHTGKVAAGMLGGADQAEYTVIGDAVNLASRIEGLTKKLATDILASEATWTRVAGKFPGARAGEESVKGRVEQVVVYRLD